MIIFRFWLYASKRNAQGKAPLYMRISDGDSKVEVSTGVFIKPSIWDKTVSNFKVNTEEVQVYQRTLNRLKDTYFSEYRRLLDTGEDFSPEDMKEAIMGKWTSTPEHTLMEALEEHLAKVRRLVGKDYSYSTYKKYKTLVTFMPEFLYKVYQKKDMLLKKIPKNFPQEFEWYLKIERGNNHNSTIKRIKHLKTVLNDAVNKGWIDKNPFDGYKLRFKPIKLIYLTEGEIRRIEQYNFKTERLRKARDIFLLMCYTGLTYIDLKELRITDIEIIKGKRWLFVDRRKTGTTSQIPLCEKALILLNKYAGKITSNQKMNEALKEIADYCGIKKNLTCHCGRRSFAMHMLNMGVSIESVAAMLGHTSTKITQQHYAKVLPERISREVEGLL